MFIKERQPGDRDRLRVMARKERDAEQKDRLLSVLHVMEGMGTLDIARALCRSRKFAQRWAYAYRDGGIEAVSPRPRGGSKPKVSGAAAARLAARLDAAIDAGLRRSGVKPECLKDARTILRGALEVNEKGEVVTKTAPNVIPGQSVEFFTVSQLRQMRPHYWPMSVGGGARGASGRADSAGDISCFDPKHANYNLTAQGAYLRTHGREAFDRARARFGGGKW